MGKQSMRQSWAIAKSFLGRRYRTRLSGIMWRQGGGREDRWLYVLVRGSLTFSVDL